jgi:ubiquinone/menaquinone biosynthesis C-methylase UbiE
MLNRRAMRTLWVHALILAALALAWAAAPVLAEDRDDWQQPDRVIADLSLHEGATVADVGCGSGYLTLRLAGAVGPDGRVLAEDIDNEGLGKLRESARAAGTENVDVILGEPADPKLGTDTVDIAVICNVLHHAAEGDRPALIEAMADALKPGGYLFIIDWRKSHDVTFDDYDELIPEDDLVTLAEDAGCTLDAEFHYLKYQVFLRFRKPVE